MESLSLIDTLKFAISMSTITISTEETIHPELSYDLVKEYVDNINYKTYTVKELLDKLEELYYVR